LKETNVELRNVVYEMVSSRLRVSDLLQFLITRLQLPNYTRDGKPVSYSLRFGSGKLVDTDMSLEDLKFNPCDTIVWDMDLSTTPPAPFKEAAPGREIVVRAEPPDRGGRS